MDIVLVCQALILLNIKSCRVITFNFVEAEEKLDREVQKLCHSLNEYINNINIESHVLYAMIASQQK